MTPLLVAAACRYAVALTFAVSALAKLRDPRAFARGVAAYRLLPAHLAAPAAALVVVAEIAVAALLLAGVATGPAAVLAAALTLAFGAAVAVNLRRHARIPCHCFTRAEQISSRTLVRLGLLLVAALVAAAGPVRAVSVADVALGAGIALLSAWALALPEIRALTLREPR